MRPQEDKDRELLQLREQVWELRAERDRFKAQIELYGRDLGPETVEGEPPALSLMHLVAESVQHFKQAPDPFVREVAEQMDIITGFHLIKDGDGLHLDIKRRKLPDMGDR